MMTIAVIITLLLFNLTFVHNRILVYNTENDGSVQRFDCVYHKDNDDQVTPYCRQSTSPLVLSRRNAICMNGGQLRSFEDLRRQDIQPEEIFEWNSSIEIADQYASFFYNRSSVEKLDQRHVCQCITPGTFGKNCEYQLTHEAESFSDAINAQFEQKRKGHPQNTPVHDLITCYATLQCDSGLLCLDWRDVNDGSSQCDQGFDEENSDKLEFNECEENEFRCTNGMCIPEEFWLDGEADCMDRSDELPDKAGDSCPFTANAMACDEHICSRNSFSCGDGQCVSRLARMMFQDPLSPQEYCFNFRHLYHMCEVGSHAHAGAWTLPNGKCWFGAGVPLEITGNWTSMDNSSKCVFLLRCALSDGLAVACPCNRASCPQILKDMCPGSVHPYPTSGLIHPNVLILYNADAEPYALAFSGRHRCRGYEVVLERSLTMGGLLETLLSSGVDKIPCMLNEGGGVRRDHSSTIKYDEHCYKSSLTFNGRPYAVNADICRETGECISQYRILDGSFDCAQRDDEDDRHNQSHCTGNVGRHRFHCYNDQHACLPLAELGTGRADCSNGYDEMWYDGGSLEKRRIGCRESETGDCARLKKYIEQSSTQNDSVFSGIQPELSAHSIPFRSYCDSFWDLKDHRDEDPSFCRFWVCEENQYQCQTGQCIELDWLCDGEWDCADASDEEGRLAVSHLSAHNQKLADMPFLMGKCRQRYERAPFCSICNTSREFGCYRSGVADPLDIAANRPCISLTQTGDGMADCYNAYDERNIFETTPGSGLMHGYNLQCDNHSESYAFACRNDAKSDCTAILCMNHRGANGSCSDVRDAVCLDGKCVKNGRCDARLDCIHGEDEYWCAPEQLSNQLSYRQRKWMQRRASSHVISQFSHNTNQVLRPKQTKKSSADLQNDNRSIALSYLCNRGVVVLQNNGTTVACFCPPAYYGNRCEFHSDRISVIAQMDEKTLPNTTLKIRAKLMFEETILDDHEFLIIPTLERIQKLKHKFYLLYSRSELMLEHKRRRYYNRTDVSSHHPYSVRFDVFSLAHDHGINELGSWHYPIDFDYLPAYRLAVVLKFPDTDNRCSQNANPNSNSTCQPVLNSESRYYYSCKRGYFGSNCERSDQLCDQYCSPHALCRESSVLQSKGQKPYCLCPLNHFGPQCNLKRHECDSRPCLNNGTCVHTADPSEQSSYTCLCPKLFFGEHCEFGVRSVVHVETNMTNTTSVRAAVVQLLYADPSLTQLFLHQQEIYTHPPSRISTSTHSNMPVLSLALLKLYQNLLSPDYYLIYSLSQTSLFRNTSSPHRCPNASSLLPEHARNSTPSLFIYHRICQNDSRLFCFHDQDYLCMCQWNNYRAECFKYSTQLDHCNNCLSGGTCLRGDLNDGTDFICICPPGSSGQRCEFQSTTSDYTTNHSTSTTTLTSRSTSETPSSNAKKMDYSFAFYFSILNLFFFH